MLPVIVCFGTNKISGDSVGAEVGTLLKTKYRVLCFVYGDQDKPIDALHAKRAIEHVKAVHGDSLVISVDACLGNAEDVGKIKIRRGGVRPGEAMKNGFGQVGDLGILAVVAERCENPISVLMTVSPFYVSKIAAQVALLLSNALSLSANLSTQTEYFS